MALLQTQKNVSMHIDPGVLSLFHLRRLVARHPCHRMNYRLVCNEVGGFARAINVLEKHLAQDGCQDHQVHVSQQRKLPVAKQTLATSPVWRWSPEPGLELGLSTHSHYYITKGGRPSFGGDWLVEKLKSQNRRMSWLSRMRVRVSNMAVGQRQLWLGASDASFGAFPRS